jgi:hypothetical protein
MVTLSFPPSASQWGLDVNTSALGKLKPYPKHASGVRKEMMQLPSERRFESNFSLTSVSSPVNLR